MNFFYSPVYVRLAIILLAATGALAQDAGRDWQPTRDSQVIETLPPRVRAPNTAVASTPQAAALAAKQAISLARQTADVRYLGRAQASLAPWWGRSDAPVELAVLQATVQQSRHEFAAAKTVLTQALQREPQHAQGWLTLATLERVAGNYPAATAACAQVTRTGAALHGAACQLETTSLQGKHDEARRGLAALQRQTPDASTQAWLDSLLAESEERAGRDGAALAAYQTSLALAPDGYTALAAADLLLRTDQAAAALKLLADQPASDAVLLRRAYALKQQKIPQWQALASELQARFAALEQRGDDPAAHARERAQAYLWLDVDAAKAWQSAKLNLTLQKEPLDWWLALHSAQRAGLTGELARLRGEVAATGLRDVRLSRLLTDRIAVGKMS
jgi:predicted Zn-dependent protease